MIERAHANLPIDERSRAHRATYEDLRAGYDRDHRSLKLRWNTVGNIRLLLFAAALGFGFAALQTGQALYLAPAAGLLAAFVAFVAWHRRIGVSVRRSRALTDINAESIDRGERDWERLPIRLMPHVAPGHPFAQDLDLLGRASLYHLLETPETLMGSAHLTGWLLNQASPAEVGARQQAVRNLAPELTWRQELQCRGRLIGKERPDPEPLLAWAEQATWLVNRRGLRLLGIVGPAAFLAALIAVVLADVPWLVLLLIGTFNIVLTQVLAAEAKPRIALVAEHYRSIAQYAQVLEHLESMPDESSWLRALKQRLGDGERTASKSLARLGYWAAFAVPPGSMPYLPLQAALAWDLNVLARLEAWQGHAGMHVRDWLRTIGDAEAISALATLAYDHPDWALPTFDPALDRVSAVAMGHPLLADEARVVNDIDVGPPGRFLLVTGSNMSGKSTLLRSIGINLVLAGAGGPVCARSFSGPPVRLWTSVRVEDSLERGVSFFMAELQRLKQIVDAAGDDGARLFYLLDEILQGTNTAERQIAARRIIRHLVDSGALGAVSTHDLTLADGPELEPVANSVHLRDIMTESGMSFDYLVRPGVATSTNALRLMDIVFGDALRHQQPFSSGSNGRTQS